jgi:hypothetical protein
MITETTNTILLRLDSAKNGEKFWVLKKSGSQSEKYIFGRFLTEW